MYIDEDVFDDEFEHVVDDMFEHVFMLHIFFDKKNNIYHVNKIKKTEDT